MSEIEDLQLRVYEDYVANLSEVEADLDGTTQTDFKIEKRVNGRPVLTSKVVDKLNAAIERLKSLRDEAALLDGLDREVKAGERHGRVDS